MNPITNAPIPTPPPPPLPGEQPITTAADGPSFKDVLLEGLDQVNQMQVDADKAVEQMFTGGDVDAAEVLTAVQKADMAFRLMMQVRNKLVQAYQEIQDVRI